MIYLKFKDSLRNFRQGTIAFCCKIDTDNSLIELWDAQKKNFDLLMPHLTNEQLQILIDDAKKTNDMDLINEFSYYKNKCQIYKIVSNSVIVNDMEHDFSYSIKCEKKYIEDFRSLTLS